MKEHETLPFMGTWSVQGYPAGTVSLGESVTLHTDNGIFMGRPLETPQSPDFTLEGKNLITATGMVLVCEMLIDTASYDTGLTYHAIGTSTVAVASGDNKLTAEFGRKAITSKSRTGKELTYSTFYTAAQSTASIQEAGIFGHNTASTASNTGILFSHYLVQVNNTASLYDLTFSYVLTVGS